MAGAGISFRKSPSIPVIPENAQRLSGTQFCSRGSATGSRIFADANSGMTNLGAVYPAAGSFHYLHRIHRTWGRSRYRSACAGEEWRDRRGLQGNGCGLCLGKLVRRRKWKHDRQRPITSPADPVSPFGVLLGCSTSALQDGRCDEARRQRSEIFLPARRAVTLQIRSHYLLFGGAPRRLPRQALSHGAQNTPYPDGLGQSGYLCRPSPPTPFGRGPLLSQRERGLTVLRVSPLSRLRERRGPPP